MHVVRAVFFQGFPIAIGTRLIWTLYRIGLSQVTKTIVLRRCFWKNESWQTLFAPTLVNSQKQWCFNVMKGRRIVRSFRPRISTAVGVLQLV